ncbi:MAG TPA: enoyl-CoA hydratase-related protein [Actinomycetota bacterium]|nr:enoyl-CoA hydratase-related protein [Actinomycetota bacterium]
MTGPFVTISRADRIATVRLERPEALNAISGALADELAGKLRALATEQEVWVVVLAAAGEKAFCVGADLKERAGFDIEAFHRNRRQVRELFSAVRDLPQPSIASVFGFALGGGFELALSCDLIVASDDAVFGLPEATVGLIPAGGGTQLLPLRVGIARAKQMIFTGERIDAGEAYRLGLVAEVCARVDLQDRTRALAERVARSSPVAVRAAKSALDAAFGTPLSDGLELENDAWAKVITSEDRAEGIAAFNEKREPNWANR